MGPDTTTPDGAATARTDTAELWVRSLGRCETVRQQAELVDRLARLESAGVLAEVDVDVWGDRLVLSGTTARTAPGRRFISRYQRFRDWAARADATLEPFFETTETVSSFTGESHTVLVFPVHTLAEFDGDEVVHVAPSVVDGEIRTVADRLAALEDGEDDDAVPPVGVTGTEETGATGAGGSKEVGAVDAADSEGSPAETDDEEPERWIGDWPEALVDPTVRGAPAPGRAER